MEKSLRCNGDRDSFAKLARVPLRTKERRSDARTTMYGLAPDYDGEISLELAHGREQCLLLYTERSDGGGKWTKFQRRPMVGAEVTKPRGPSGTR